MNNRPNIWLQQGGQVSQPSVPTFAPNYGMFPAPTQPFNWNQPVLNSQQNVQQPVTQNSNMNATGSNWRFVNNPDEVLPAEVPMNGAFGVFVANDLSHIYLKYWNKQGGIDTAVYSFEKPEPEISVKEVRETFPEFNQIMTRLDDLFALLSNPQPTSTSEIPKKATQRKETKENV